MKKNLVFLKAHELNLGLIDEYQKIKKSGVDVLIVFDNKNQRYHKSESKVQTLNIMGLDIDFYFTDFDIYEQSKLPGYYDEKEGNNFNRFMWYNADYPLYLIYDMFPNYDYYWQIEYDVYCNGKSYKPFFSQYKSDKNDLLIVRYATALDAWWATEKSEWWFSKNSFEKKCCILPILRISRQALDYLYTRRLELGEVYEKRKIEEDVRWIFCELFVATELGNNEKFKVAPILNQYITDSPIINLAQNRLYLNPDNKLYHPVK